MMVQLIHRAVLFRLLTKKELAKISSSSICGWSINFDKRSIFRVMLVLFRGFAKVCSAELLRPLDGTQLRFVLKSGKAVVVGIFRVFTFTAAKTLNETVYPTDATDGFWFLATWRSTMRGWGIYWGGNPHKRIIFGFVNIPKMDRMWKVRLSSGWASLSQGPSFFSPGLLLNFRFVQTSGPELQWCGRSDGGRKHQPHYSQHWHERRQQPLTRHLYHQLHAGAFSNEMFCW